MINKVLFIAMATLLSTPALAAKPAQAEKNNPQKMQIEKKAKKAKKNLVEENESIADTKKSESLDKISKKEAKSSQNIESEGDKSKNSDKQANKKSEQQMKEQDKGSEQGQEARAKRKKWWKFWE